MDTQPVDEIADDEDAAAPELPEDLTPDSPDEMPPDAEDHE